MMNENSARPADYRHSDFFLGSRQTCLSYFLNLPKVREVVNPELKGSAEKLRLAIAEAGQ
jgi:hypothetical protein